MVTLFRLGIVMQRAGFHKALMRLARRRLGSLGLSLPAILSLLIFLSACSSEDQALPTLAPVADRFDYIEDWHDTQINDPYRYLADSSDPATEAYLAAEKRWFDLHSAAFDSYRDTAARHLDGYLHSSVISTPYKSGDYEFFNQQELGDQYPVFYRRHLMSGDTSLVLDVNKLAAGAGYFRLGSFAIHDNGELIAYTEDRNGNEVYTVGFVDIRTQQTLGATVGGAAPSITWSGDRLLYIDLKQSAVVAISPNQPLRELIYDEPDPAFSLSLANASSGRAIITAESLDSTEIHVLDSAGDLLLVQARRPGHRYRIQLRDDKLVVLSNLQDVDFSLAEGDLAEKSFMTLRWLPDVPGQILDFETIDAGIAIHRRHAMLETIDVIDAQTFVITELARTAPGESLQLLGWDAPAAEIRFRRQGFVNPGQVMGYAPVTGELNVIDTATLPGALATDAYQAELLFIAASDGVQIPVTLMYKKHASASILKSDLQTAESLPRPMMVTGYGAYGLTETIRFEPRRFLQLDDGFLVAVIHVRGGGELGRRWHIAGSRENGLQSARDLIDVTQSLIEAGRAMPDQIFAEGTSAGATLVATAMNLNPGLFNGVILRAGFFDMLNTLGREQAPLTASDWLEWGNPGQREEFLWLRDLSPYENIRSDTYPDILLLASGNDQRVQIHESLKYLARLRHRSVGDTLMLIDIDNDSGHLGASDQYSIRRQVTLEHSFLMTRVNEVSNQQ